MKNENYNNAILRRIEKSFDRIMPISALISFLSAVIIFFSNIPVIFVYVDMVIALIFVLLTILKEKLKVETKIMITVLVPAILGVASFLHGGFSSSGIQLLLICNVFPVLYLSKSTSIKISTLSMFVLIVLWLCTVKFDFPIDSTITTSKWLIQLLTLSLFLTIFHISVFSIKKHLLENIEELEKTVEQTYELAYYDRLTGLANYLTFKDYIRKRLRDGVNEGHIVYYKLKDLNLINSLHNSDFADKVLLAISKTFKDILKTDEYIGKKQGSEFILWFEIDKDPSLIHRLEALEKDFSNNFEMSGLRKKVEFYIGYAKISKGEMTVKECYEKATTAVTYAKINNLSERVTYDKTLDETIKENEILKNSISLAIKNKEFTLVYQEKINAVTNKVVGVEALSRWVSNELGFVSPGRFVPIIEKMNMSRNFGELVIENSFCDYKCLVDRYGEDIKLSINISPSHLCSDGFMDYVKMQIEENNITEKNIIFEVTEEVLIEGLEKVRPVISELKKLGLKVSLDDFGTGYSSLNYLIQLDIDELKIDRSLIMQIKENDKAKILLELLINLARKLKLDLVAEGVEDKEQVDILVDLGCYIIQGYFYSKPKAL